MGNNWILIYIIYPLIAGLLVLFLWECFKKPRLIFEICHDKSFFYRYRNEIYITISASIKNIGRSGDSIQEIKLFLGPPKNYFGIWKHPPEEIVQSLILHSSVGTIKVYRYINDNREVSVPFWKENIMSKDAQERFLEPNQYLQGKLYFKYPEEKNSEVDVTLVALTPKKKRFYSKTFKIQCNYPQ